MHGKYVERIVYPKPMLDHPGRNATHDAAHDSDRYGADWPDIARGRSDRRQTGNAAGGDTDRARLAKAAPFDDDPDKTRRGRGKLGREDRRSGRGVGGERAAAVEAEPTDPQH